MMILEINNSLSEYALTTDKKIARENQDIITMQINCIQTNHKISINFIVTEKKCAYLTKDLVQIANNRPEVVYKRTKCALFARY